jgi:hypothetical protein
MRIMVAGVMIFDAPAVVPHAALQRNAAKNGHMAEIFNARNMGRVVVQARAAP